MQASRLLTNDNISAQLADGRNLIAAASTKDAIWVKERLEYEAEFASNDGARVSALDKLMKFHGEYEKDNRQKIVAARSEELERLLAIAGGDVE